MKTALTLHALLLILILCGGCSPHPTNWMVVAGPSARPNPWRVDAAEVPRLLVDGKAFLQGLAAGGGPQAAQAKRLLARWDDFACQVIGYREDGRQKIELSFVPMKVAQKLSDVPWEPEAKRLRPDHKWHWRRDYLGVSDGGEDFWHLRYDYPDKEFVQLWTNGEA